MSSHSKAAKRFVADAERMAWHDKALYAVREKRDRMMESVPEWEELRRLSSEIKRHTLSRLGHYLCEFERNATANGMQVHWAQDAAGMNTIVWDLVRRHGGHNLIKSKSMLSEECGLTPFLRERGIDAVESDLGERIMQLLHQPPSHIVLPAIGVRREEVGALFEREMGTEPGNSDPTYLTHAARKALRPKFLGADIAMTGVNFAVASTGALAVCTNEGNADLGTSFPDLHIAIMGLEKVIPDMRALGVFTRLLARSGTGQPVTTYTSLYRRPAPGKEIHVILVDNGRSEWLADAEHRNMLKCLRCGACMNTCPVYRRSGEVTPTPISFPGRWASTSACSVRRRPTTAMSRPARCATPARRYAPRRSTSASRSTSGASSSTRCTWPIRGKRRPSRAWMPQWPPRNGSTEPSHWPARPKKLPRPLLENRLNPWSVPGRALPRFARESFNARWKQEGCTPSAKTKDDE